MSLLPVFIIPDSEILDYYNDSYIKNAGPVCKNPTIPIENTKILDIMRKIIELYKDDDMECSLIPIEVMCLKILFPYDNIETRLAYIRTEKHDFYCSMLPIHYI